jgi:hypothetical protein
MSSLRTCIGALCVTVTNQKGAFYWKVDGHFSTDGALLEALFEALNVGTEDPRLTDYERRFREARNPSLSVGDVVTIHRACQDGVLDLTYHCENTGWSHRTVA